MAVITLDGAGEQAIVAALYLVVVNLVAMFLPPPQDDLAFFLTWGVAWTWILMLP